MHNQQDLLDALGPDFGSYKRQRRRKWKRRLAFVALLVAFLQIVGSPAVLVSYDYRGPRHAKRIHSTRYFTLEGTRQWDRPESKKDSVDYITILPMMRPPLTRLKEAISYLMTIGDSHA